MVMFTQTRWERSGQRDPLERAIEWLLIGTLAFMPFAFGAVEAWSEEIVIVLVALASVCFCAKVARGTDHPFLWTPAYIPVLVFLLMAVAQLIPLPAGWVRLASPHTVATKTELAADLQGQDAQQPFLEISFYPYATEHDLRLLLAAATVFVITLNVFRRPAQIMRLLLAIAVIGAGVAVLTLAQDLLGNGKIYWCVPSPNGQAFSGPFINHSHCAQFMNLSMGSALALVLVRLQQAFQGRRASTHAVVEYLRSPDGRFLLILCAIIVLAVAAVFVSLSRGGMMGLTVAWIVTTLVVGCRKTMRGPGWIMTFLAFGAFICVLYVGFDSVYDRLGSLRNLNEEQAGRWQMVKDIGVAWTEFPVMGTGLGTHEVVYPMFDRGTVAAVASHAENEYAQAAEETGTIGLAALLAFGVFVWRGYVRTIRTARIPIHAAAYGLGFGLLAIMVHSLSDFGQHLPANASLSAVFCALLIRLPHVTARDEVVSRETAALGQHTRFSGLILLAVVGAAWGWAILGADAARRGQAHWSKALDSERLLAKRDWQGSDEEYRQILAEAASAQDCQPGNVKYRHWSNVYRWRAISRITDPHTGEVLLTQRDMEFASRIADELKRALAVCPVYGPTWSVLGQLEKFILGRNDAGIRHIRRGRALAPQDPVTCFVAGRLHADEGDVNAAFADWQRAAELDETLFPEVASSLIGVLNRPDLSCRLAGTDTDRLICVEALLRGSGGDASLLTDVSGRLAPLLEQESQKPDAPAWKFAWLAQRYSREARIDDAIQMYHKALALQYGQVSWRLSLAELLVGRGLTSEAIRELSICLRLQPHSQAAQELSQRLSIQADGGAGRH